MVFAPKSFASNLVNHKGVFGGNDVVTRLQEGMPEKFNNLV